MLSYHTLCPKLSPKTNGPIALIDEMFSICFMLFEYAVAHWLTQPCHVLRLDVIHHEDDVHKEA